MKTSITTIIIILFFTFQIHAQTLNQEILEDGETPFLLGEIDKTGLTSENYKDWFSKQFDDYVLDANIIEQLTPLLKAYQITVFMGTWCGDSQQEVPRFYKILEACEFPKTQLKVFALSSKPNMYKKSPNHDEAGFNIHRVPTFIFYKDKKEVNRIVEHPIETFEIDMLQILTKNDYKSNYHIVTTIDNILKVDGLHGLQKQSKKLVKTFDGKVDSMFELNTYGRILYSTNRLEEAITVFDLNTKLFPDQPRTYISLVNTLGISGEREKAVNVLEKALTLFPENEDLIKNFELIKTN